MKEMKKGEILIQTGQTLNSLLIITSGSVRAVTSGETFLLQKGDVIGLFDLSNQFHTFTYIVETDATLIPYEFADMEEFGKLITSRPELCQILDRAMSRLSIEILNYYQEYRRKARSLFRFLKESHFLYQGYCRNLHFHAQTIPGIDSLEDLQLDEESPFWLNEYYQCIHELSLSKKHIMDPRLVLGFLYKASSDIYVAVCGCQQIKSYCNDNAYFLLNSEYLDYFELYTHLYFRALNAGQDAASLYATIQKLITFIKENTDADPELCQNRLLEFESKLAAVSNGDTNPSVSSVNINSELLNSVDVIFEYAKGVAITASEFKKYLNQYKQLTETNKDDPAFKSLLSKLTQIFYMVYTETFQMSLQDKQIPTVVKMFLNFGYMDADLAGYENASYLYSLVNSYQGDPSNGVYTIHEWLQQIYLGKKQPSRNEFEIDYTSYIHTLRSQGKITASAEQQMAEDSMAKVLFELENMFPFVNKITHGRHSFFCPIFTEETIVRPLPDVLVKPENIHAVINRIVSVDYLAFCRDYLYSDEKVGIRDTIQLEIYPDIILLPNVGTGSILWQEIEGMHRNSPGRMMLSVFHLENLEKTFIRLVGEFRWDICKRIQGARWNDVSEPSLTAEYFDYAQFFTKNRDLSPDAREKIKLSLMRSRNNFKELFLSDYAVWIQSEASCSPKLNKVSRSILFTYCPFAKATRDLLENNPIYADPLSKHKIKSARRLHHINADMQKYRNSNLAVPEALLTYRQIFER